MASPVLIKDKRYFPRSEYYTRFKETTAFLMDDPKYWGTYHRSESTRFFNQAGGRKAIEFSSHCTQKPAKVNSFFAHVGGIRSPFSIKYYQDAIGLTQRVPEYEINVRDQLLDYKCKMAETIVAGFETENDNEQKIKKARCRVAYHVRPIVYYENHYPCVLIQLPILNPLENKTDSAAYWAKHPKPLQRLLMASFIALLNVAADKANIPIEMVIRASFGHNLPSICETANTFRINVGVVPKVYAELIGKTLSQLDMMIDALINEPMIDQPISAAFKAKVRGYNAGKLRKAIDKKTQFSSMRGSEDYKDAADSDKAFDRLYNRFCQLNKPGKGRANFVPVKLEGNSIWKIIQEAGDTKGRPILAECFRENESVDWFADAVMEALFEHESNPIEAALHRMLKLLDYGDKVTMDYNQIHEDLNREKWEFDDLSFNSLFENDHAFANIIEHLFKAFCKDRPEESVYAYLEKASVDFFKTKKGSKKVQTEDDFGSDSSFSDDIVNKIPVVSGRIKKNIFSRHHFSHAKLRVCSGMKAIVLAQYGALGYLKKLDVKKYKQDVEQMYYEVESALKMVNVTGIAPSKVVTDLNSSILQFDLNHCNASNAADNVTLVARLALTEASIVILDYTSTTLKDVEKSAGLCLDKKHVKFVIMVDSGLKNNQGGADYNPYGEVRVLARNRQDRDELLGLLKTGLSEGDKLSSETHEMVRACKRRGLAVSFMKFFEQKSASSSQQHDAPTVNKTIKLGK